ncbi:MAG TPA: Rieske 2Fe-2S domain-containing protein [Ktedonobacteraceae bacterium]|nr:Rieske 2Fe-2S domain-containing protein [Ktedonobacteraceae bacterium]
MSETPVQVPGPEMASAPPPAPQPFTERLSDTLQHAIGVIVGSGRKPPRRLKSLLNGTWLGHPLHPVMTDVPITAWVLTAVFDIIWLIAHPTWAAYGAFVTVIVGLLGALGAIVTGLTDWSDTYGAERRVGLNHALFNACATILYLVSFILRLLAGPGDGIAAVILGFVGLASVFYAAYLGGDMVFTKGTGVNHTAWEVGSEDYEVVLPEARVEENTLYRVTATGVPVVLLRQGSQFYAISATCPHAGGPLDEGTLTGDIVQCPWHGSRFCMRDGHVLTGPATVDAPRYDVRVRNGQVEVKRVGDH